LSIILRRSLDFMQLHSATNGSQEHHRYTKGPVSFGPLVTLDLLRLRSHPLQELVVDTFIPNDALLVGGCDVAVEQDDGEDDVTQNGLMGKNRVIVCTGANACGKSVYIKQIAMIQYMAQVRLHLLTPILTLAPLRFRLDGEVPPSFPSVHLAHIASFVPAESATLGIVDKSNIPARLLTDSLLTLSPVFTRVQTRESVSKVIMPPLIRPCRLTPPLVALSRSSLPL